MTSGELIKRMKRADYTRAGKPKQDSGRIEEKISCSSVFIDMSVVAISGR